MNAAKESLIKEHWTATRFAKAAAKRTIRAIFAALPRNALDTVLDELSVVLRSDRRRRRSRFRLLSRLAQDSQVVALSVGGDYGVMQSTSSDTNILFQYSDHQHFALRTNEEIAEFFGDGGGTYLDIGANIGMTSIPIARNPLVRCVAFEPEPANFANLLANIGANCPHGNVVAKQIALFSHAGSLRFELDNENLGDHRVRMNDLAGDFGEHNRRSIEVQACALDDALPDIVLPLAIKIDTQGAEPFVFLGGRAVIARAGLLISEFWPYGMDRMGGDVDGMLQILAASFGTIAVATAEEGAFTEPVTAAAAIRLLSDLHRKHAAEPHWYCDIVARK